MQYEYKTVGAPEKGKRKRGVRNASDRVAAAFEEILEREAVDGWEYQRTDLLPVNERNGWFSRVQETHRAVMVFRRPVEDETVVPVALPLSEAASGPSGATPTLFRPIHEAPPLRTAPIPKPAPSPAQERDRREPTVEPVADPDMQIAALVRGTDGKAD